MKHIRPYCYILALFFFAAALIGSSGSLFAAEAGNVVTGTIGYTNPQPSDNLPPVWLVTPFLVLLLMIATGPLLYHRFWEDHYAMVACGLGLVVSGYYGFFMRNGTQILEHTLEEYLSFIILISSLFVVTGGILIKIERRGSPWINALVLMFGALIANVIGTTGASMLLIRPYLRINEGRLKAFHIVFFIFIVSNIGGGLTPIGDPPLFLGFLKGVPFFWVFPKVFLPWVITVSGLLLLFIALDIKAGNGTLQGAEKKGGVTLKGAKNLWYLAAIIAAVFCDPAVIEGFPSLQNLVHVPFGIRELIMFGVAFAAFKTADKEALRRNEFNFEPIKEVAFLFIGIFATMIPALALIEAYAATHASDLSVSSFYWMTGALSGVLDNAPTYLNFLAAALGKFGLDIGSPDSIRFFAKGMDSPVQGDVSSDIYLMAISVASVFFGAISYIGNAPNFMVKNIAAQADVDVPDFVEYIFKYSIPILLPFFILVWVLFIYK
ncbi:MAG: sodium:proton antiporter [Chlorobiales bacterium]|nr:sodium:proton antiporter [Chlorobiales bacterium]